MVTPVSVIPLSARPTLLRWDVLPFLVAYSLLIVLDGLSAALVDVLWPVLLLGQLGLFLQCRWNPMWRARVAFREFGGGTGHDEGDHGGRAWQMRRWTHALLTAESVRGRPDRPGIAPIQLQELQPTITTTATTATTAEVDIINTITTVVAVAHFRGWTYRCCCTFSHNSQSLETAADNANQTISFDTDISDQWDPHADIPMESIFRNDKKAAPDILDTTINNHETNNRNKRDNNNQDTTPWTPQFHRRHYPIDLPLDFYLAWRGHDTTTTLQLATLVYDRNRTPVPLPHLLSLLGEQLLQPMFLFQLFCVLLWCLDEYWIYALFTLLTLVLFELTLAYNRWRGIKRLREEVLAAEEENEPYPNDSNFTKSSSTVSSSPFVECYRLGIWTSIPADQLVVGDVVSLVSPSMTQPYSHHSQPPHLSSSARTNRHNTTHTHERGTTIPADLLLLRGRAVVNEAMLTGESVPQVKESIRGEVPLTNTANKKPGSTPRLLDLSEGSVHNRCVLFGGTVLMDHHSEEQEENEELGDIGFFSPPNQGLLCFVLRTGFDTVQGSLLRTLVYHAEGGGSSGHGEGVNSKETFYFLWLLLVFALLSAATVLQHAWGDVTRNHFKLILHVIIIITSVIPPELPMELSLAVTTSLSELIKRCQVHCTEPFRIPLAGLVDTCCFDKTGTLTSDELKLHGVRLPVRSNAREKNIGAGDHHVTHPTEEDEGLVLLDRILSKDMDIGTENGISRSKSEVVRSLFPRETLRVMVGCQSLAVTHTFVPGRGGRTFVQRELCGDPLEKAVMEACGWTLHPCGKSDVVVEKDKSPSSTSPSSLTSGIRILHRFAFSSKLRRMTVLALDSEVEMFDDTTTYKNEKNDENKNKIGCTIWALTKGAPEAILPMLDPNFLPQDYKQSYLKQMSLGRRVLALAYRNLGKNTASALTKWKSSRDEVEQNLVFAGLLVMDCPLKYDSARVIKELRAGQQQLVMITGDAVLTAAEVARRVGIIESENQKIYEMCRWEKETADQETMGDFGFAPLGFDVDNDSKDKESWIKYTPANLGKLESLVRRGNAAICITGDILLSLAVAAIQQKSQDTAAFIVDESTALNHPAARAELSELVSIVSVFARHAPRQKEAVVAILNSFGRHTLMCGDGTNDIGALKEAHVGVSIISVPDVEAKERYAHDIISAVKLEEKKERKVAKKQLVSLNTNGVQSFTTNKKSHKTLKQTRMERLERSLEALAEAEEDVAHISLGNASIASPFTSRKTSIRCCKDILQQGRCTLVTMIQIYKILGVNCLVSALVLTKLHQKGVKQGDRQMTAQGLVVAGLFLFVTRGNPLPKLSPKRPPSSVLCKETLLSMAMQFGVHFAAIMAVTSLSDAYVDPYDPSLIPDGPFVPNTLNTATFLVTVLATINTFAVNYQGQPFMENLTSNKILFRSIQICYLVLFVCALDMFPPLNQLLQLSSLPSMGPPSYDRESVSEYREIVEVSGVMENVLQGWMMVLVRVIGFRLMLCIIMCLDTICVIATKPFVQFATGS